MSEIVLTYLLLCYDCLTLSVRDINVTLESSKIDRRMAPSYRAAMQLHIYDKFEAKLMPIVLEIDVKLELRETNH